MEFISKWQLTGADITGLVLLVAAWWGYPLVTRLLSRPDLTGAIEAHRAQWMVQMLHREERITDVSLARGLFGSVSFFASTAVLVISGLVGLLATAPQIYGRFEASDLFTSSGLLLFEGKFCLLIAIFVHAFFKLVWSMRLHSYSTILIGAAPQKEAKDSAEAKRITTKAAALSTLASHHYLGGMRGYYFGLATLTWFLSPYLLIPAVILTLIELIRREHFSRAFAILADE